MEFHRASALDLPFDDESFDVVTMFDVVEHLPRGSEARALSEARRVLRRGGELAVSTPNRHWLATYGDPAYYVGHRHYRREQLERLVAASGFVVRTTSVGGRLFDHIDLLLYYAVRHLARREGHPFGFVRRLADREWEAHTGWNTLFLVATKPAP